MACLNLQRRSTSCFAAAFHLIPVTSLLLNKTQVHLVRLAVATFQTLAHTHRCFPSKHSFSPTYRSPVRKTSIVTTSSNECPHLTPQTFRGKSPKEKCFAPPTLVLQIALNCTACLCKSHQAAHAPRNEWILSPHAAPNLASDRHVNMPRRKSHVSIFDCYLEKGVT